MAWKIYAWGMLALAAVTLVGRLAIRLKRPGLTHAWDLIEAVLNLVLIPGLFGFAYGRAYYSHWFWQFAVPLAWAGMLYSMVSPTHRKLAREKGLRVAIPAALGSLVLNVPGMVALTLYAYSRPEIWR